jgi:hypothetical protein
LKGLHSSFKELSSKNKLKSERRKGRGRGVWRYMAELMGNLFFKVRGRSFQQTRKIQALDSPEFQILWAASSSFCRQSTFSG